jgi:hypothetical protein
MTLRNEQASVTPATVKLALQQPWAEAQGMLTIAGLVVGVVAVVDRVLECGDIPSILEVAVPREAGGVAGNNW